jgi:hypothetical protein
MLVAVHQDEVDVFVSTRHGPRLPFSLNKFFGWTNTLAAITICRLTTNPHGQLLPTLIADLAKSA